MCSEHEDLVWEHRSTLYQLFSQSVLCLSFALSSSHATDCWIGILLDSSLFLFFPPPPSLSSYLPLYLSGALCDTKKNRVKKKKGGGGGTTSRQIEAERARGDGTQRNMRLLSKNTSLSVSQPSILICMRKSARSQMQVRAWHARVYTQTYTLQGQPACVFASTHFHSR